MNLRDHGLKTAALGFFIVAGTGLGVFAADEPSARNEPAPSESAPVQAAKEWVKPNDRELKKLLSREQYDVTQKEGTERPFKNAYWDNKKEGIYVDIVSGEPLFSSKDKFKSGTGWPSFTRPLVKQHIVEKQERRWGISRTELRSRNADSHLGHVFDDGPNPTGLRYCINSASLRFIPKDDLSTEGYDEFVQLFKE